MSIGRVFLGFSESSNIIVGRGAFWALHIFIVNLIQASLVERVFAEEMNLG